MPLKLSVGELLFSAPRNLIKSFSLDLAAAGIEKEDERGRTDDLHALQHTFSAHLSKNGVAARTAKAGLPHSFQGVTMRSARQRRERTSRKPTGRVPNGGDGKAAHNAHAAPTLLDVAAAVEALPILLLRDQGDAPEGRAWV